MQHGITTRNIQSQWQATGLTPYNLSAVFEKLAGRYHMDNDALSSISIPIQI